MRNFLVYKKENNKIIILGFVQSDQYPSTIANDHEYAKSIMDMNM